MIYLLIITNVFLLVTGQLLWKHGITQTGFHLTTEGIIKIISNGYIIGGMMIYVLATIIWLYVLSKKNISSVYPLQSLCYVVALFAGWLIFKEKLSLNHWIGVSFIVFGAFIINI
jgi:uncharacterized membrane protein